MQFAIENGLAYNGINKSSGQKCIYGKKINKQYCKTTRYLDILRI